MKANTANPPPPGQVSAPAEAVTALYRAHALGLVRLAVVMPGDRGRGAGGVPRALPALAQPMATGKIVRGFGHWIIARAGNLVINVLWSNSSGSLLIDAIPTTGTGQVGVISGNTFTPLPGQANSTAGPVGGV